jgi:hypothetical protein
MTVDRQLVWKTTIRALSSETELTCFAPACLERMGGPRPNTCVRVKNSNMFDNSEVFCCELMFTVVL